MGIITIDGLSGVGKTARAISLAKKLGYRFISFGYIFRAISYAKLVHIEFNMEHFKFEWHMDDLHNPFKIFCQGEEITDILHGTPEIDKMCYKISKSFEIENLAIHTLKMLIDHGSFVIEGRNTNTLFSNIEISYFLFCSEEERNKRLALEMKNKGRNLKQSEEVLQISNKRDTADRALVTTFLDDKDKVLYIDSTLFTPEDTLGEMLRYRNYFLKKESTPMILICLSNDYATVNRWVENFHDSAFTIKKIILDKKYAEELKRQYSSIDFCCLDMDFVSGITNDTENSIVIVLKNSQDILFSKINEIYIKPHLFGNNLLVCSAQNDLLKLLSQKCSAIESSFSFRTTFFQRLEAKEDIVKYLKVIKNG
ncbi:(d)CMP kinase [Paenibacillus zanthoxyli]|uniref:(d)CMP kinase n=1 Tax=Paenibacillus zanthoxyli TaxID=369399 RepID=UPI00046F34F9|nr:(d)CMP kinase [Paenibacillus zanthoxyli]